MKMKKQKQKKRRGEERERERERESDEKRFHLRTTRPRATMSALDLENEIFQSVEEVDEEILRMTADEISRRTRLLENEIRVLKDESTRLSLDLSSTKEKVKDNKEKIKFNKQLPYLVGNNVEILDANAEDEVRKQNRKQKPCL